MGHKAYSNRNKRLTFQKNIGTNLTRTGISGLVAYKSKRPRVHLSVKFIAIWFSLLIASSNSFSKSKHLLLNHHSLKQPPFPIESKTQKQKKPEKVLLPLPPPSCPLKVLNRSNTVKGLRQDPFLLAYKQCTKSNGSSSFKRLFTGLFTRKNEKKKGAGVNGSELKRSDSKFSFKNSRAEPLPRDKSRRLLRSMSVR
ncbi:hypothetical protein M0R45_001495 [Rubus argutus]|uniref:Uncharacterized protein n=1 Tax=Rubus argutus TaxID=59490 RepID=A0AAW1VKF9_RUBAR